MRKLSQGAFALTTALLLAGPVFAQAQIKLIQVQPAPINTLQLQPGVSGDRLALLRSKDVQADLKLTAQQIKKIEELDANTKKVVEGMKGIELFKKLSELSKANNKAIEDLLNGEQNKRVGQLELQQRGPLAFFDAKVRQELGLDQQHFTQIQMLLADSGKRLADAFKDAKGDLQEMQKRMSQIYREMVDEIVKSLTPEQKAKWKALVGEPFKGVLPGGFGGVIGPGGVLQIQPLPGGQHVPPVQVRPVKIQVKKAPTDKNGQ
jgi:hypothetical protein